MWSRESQFQSWFCSSTIQKLNWFLCNCLGSPPWSQDGYNGSKNYILTWKCPKLELKSTFSCATHLPFHQKENLNKKPPADFSLGSTGQNWVVCPPLNQSLVGHDTMVESSFITHGQEMGLYHHTSEQSRVFLVRRSVEGR